MNRNADIESTIGRGRRWEELYRNCCWEKEKTQLGVGGEW